MNIPLEPERPPLRIDGGVVRVGTGRITLDLIVEQYESGATPEDMVRAFDTLVLADIYGAIAYYLRHLDPVRDYLRKRAAEARALQTAIEREHPRITREELLRRRTAARLSSVTRNELPVIQTPAGTRPIDPDSIRESLEEEGF